MELSIKTINGKNAGKLTVSDAVFGLEPREDILARMVRYQLAKRQAGTHKAKTRNELTATGKKFVRQKGSGGARHGDKKAPQFRGGGKPFGPIARDHSHDLPKKIRALALKLALSSKVKSERLVIVDDASCDGKTKSLKTNLSDLGLSNVLFVDGQVVNEQFLLASRNIPNVDVLPIQGINVYDILRRDTLVLTKAAVEALEERFK